MNRFTVLIAGGGLGGLALANALVDHSDLVAVKVAERDAHEKGYRPQGYRIGLDSEGLAALDGCGLSKERLEGAGLDSEALSKVKVADAGDLSVLLGFPASGGGIVSRWLLHETLRERVGHCISYDKKLQRFEQHGERVTAYFHDGTEMEADLLVGADGLNSAVRGQWAPSLQVQDSGVTGLAGDLDVAELVASGVRVDGLLALSEGSLVRLLGPGGYSWLLLRYTDEETSRDHLLWCLNHTVDSPADDYQGPREQWLEYAVEAASFEGGGHPELRTLVQATALEKLLPPRHQTHLLAAAVRANPFEKAAVSQPRVCLLGDAAHAMTTHRGLGANTAFMDARDLSAVILELARRHAAQTPLSSDAVRQLLTPYHALCSNRGADRIAGSLSSTHSMHVKSKWARAGMKLFMRIINLGICLFLFFRRLFFRH